MGARRPYRSDYRRRVGGGAAQTRELITAAARRRFGAGGYAATTIADIAKEAGLAVQTVYANFPSKRGILAAVIATIDADPELDDLSRRYSAAAGALERLEFGLHRLRLYMERAADIDRIVRGAATADSELVATWHNGEAARRRHAGQMVEALRAEGRLLPGLGDREAEDLLHLVTAPEVYEILVERSGWTADDYERWVRLALDVFMSGHRYRPVLP